MSTRPLVLAGALAGFIALSDSASAQYWTRTTAPSTNWGPIACSADGFKVVAAVGVSRQYPIGAGPIYTSSDRGDNWTPTSAPIEAWISLASSADGATLLACPESGSPYVSNDGGSTWTPANLFVTNWDAAACSADGTRMLVMGSGPVYQSTDSGASWTSTLGLIGGNCMALSADGRFLVVGRNPGNIYTFTNRGTFWQLSNTGPSSNWVSVACSVDGATLLGATSPMRLFPYPGVMFTSKDYGATWQRAGSPGAGWRAVASSADGAHLAAISTVPGFPEASSTIYISSNSGVTWTNTLGTALNWQELASSADGSLKWATGQGGICFWQATPAPLLRLTQSTDTVTVSWIVPPGNFGLQQNPDLTPANWTDVTVPPVFDYNTLQYEVTLPLTPGAAFYRLVSK
jgi:hypothetical protein